MSDDDDQAITTNNIYETKFFKHYTICYPKPMYKDIGYSSMVLSNNSCKLLSLMISEPQKFRLFESKYPNINEWTIMEMVHGTNIQLFYDDSRQIWEIATKRNVGGFELDRTTKKTYRERFLSAFLGKTYRPSSVLEWNQAFDSLNKNYSYQFILKAESSREASGLLKTESSREASGLLKTESSREEDSLVLLTAFQEQNIIPAYSVMPKLSPKYVILTQEESTPLNETNKKDLFYYYGSIFSKPDISGLIIISNSGEKTKIDNIAYYNKKEYETFDKRDFFEYLCLRYLNMTFLYTGTNPFSSSTSNIYEKHLNIFIQGLWEISQRRKKGLLLSKISTKYSQAFLRLGYSDYMTIETIKQHFNSLSPIDIFECFF